MARRTLLILLGIYVVNFMDRQLLAILAEPIKREMDLTDTHLGVLYGFTFAIFFTLVGIPLAWLADRFNRARIITWALVLFSVMTALCGLASNYWYLLLARIGVGVGEAGTGPPSQSMIADLYPLGERSTAMGVFAVGAPLGLLLGFLVGGVFGQAMGWRSTFVVAGAISILMAVLATVFLREPARERAHGAAASLEPKPDVREVMRVLWRYRAMRQLFTASVVWTIGTSALLGWLPAFLMRSHGLSMSETGVLLALVLGVGAGVGTAAGGLLADKLGRRDAAWRLRVVAISLMIAIPCWAVVFTADRSAHVLILLVLGGLLLGVPLGPTFAMVQSLVPPHVRALAASLLLFSTNLVGLGLGPLLAGSLSDALQVTYGQHSLRVALLIVPPLFAWAAWHFHAASRTIASDLQASSRAGAENGSAARAPQFADAADAHFR